MWSVTSLWVHRVTVASSIGPRLGRLARHHRLRAEHRRSMLPPKESDMAFDAVGSAAVN